MAQKAPPLRKFAELYAGSKAFTPREGSLLLEEIQYINARAGRLYGMSTMRENLYGMNGFTRKDLPPGFMEEVETMMARLLAHPHFLNPDEADRDSLTAFHEWSEAYMFLARLRFTLPPEERTRWREHLETVQTLFGKEPSDPSSVPRVARVRTHAVVGACFGILWPRIENDPEAVVPLLLDLRRKWLGGNVPPGGEELLWDPKWVNLFAAMESMVLPPDHESVGKEKWAALAAFLPEAHAWWQDFFSSPATPLSVKQTGLFILASKLYSAGRSAEAVERLNRCVKEFGLQKVTSGHFKLLVLQCDIALNGLGDRDLASDSLAELGKAHESLDPNEPEYRLYDQIKAKCEELLNRPQARLAQEAQANNRSRFDAVVLGSRVTPDSTDKAAN